MREKGSYLSRSSLIAICICLVVLLAFFSLSYLDLKNISVLQSSSVYLSKQDTAITLLRTSDERLGKAENHYRLYLNSADTAYRTLFLSDINDAISSLEAVSGLDSGFTRKILQNVNSKINYYSSIESLKKLADSIIHEAAPPMVDTAVAASGPIRFTRVQKAFLQKYFSTATDTVKLTPQRKKGFLGKLSAIFSGNERLKTEYVRGKRTDKKYTDSLRRQSNSAMNDLAARIGEQYQRTINSQLHIQNELSSQERALAETNLSIVSDINDKIRDLISQTEAAGRAEKERVISKIDGAGSSIRKIRFFSLLSITVLIGMLIYNIYRTNKYEEAIVSARISAEKMSRLKSRFLSNISHEIRSPLTGIMGFTEEMMQGETSGQNVKYLNAIKVSSDHLLHTVNDILDFSKLEAGKLRLIKEPFLLRNAIEEVIFAFSLQARKKNIYLRMKGAIEEDLSLLGDAHRFKQILYNLISNAVKFTDDGGVEVAVEIRTVDAAKVTAVVSVRDTGVGIPSGQLGFIFEEFTQAYSDDKKEFARAIQGTGLGLPICKMLVELQSGTIAVESAVRKGSVFTFRIPYAIAKAPSHAAFESAQTEPKGHAKDNPLRKILVVEDNEFNIMLLSILLNRMEYPFDVASDGESALQLFRAGNYGLVITDINIPRLTGLELAGLIRKDGDPRKAATPIIALTADIIGSDFDQYSKEGINTVITKPFKEESFRRLVENYLAV
jgi:signal transduction histidine kinase/CheY-like chemotaxis protein